LAITQPDRRAPVAAEAVDGWPADAVLAVEELTSTVQELRERAEQLQRALESRVAIEQAKGVLAERYALAPDAAFAFLRSAARSARLPLHELAQRVVDSPSTPDEVARQLARGREERT
jgi:AmiR/NasT family two-component response regulator